jgi:peroxiredoxin
MARIMVNHVVTGGVVLMLILAFFAVPSFAELEMVPEVKLKDLAGKPFAFADNKGKVVLAVFWAVWCPHCKKETPLLIDCYNKYKDQGLVVLGIAIDSGDDKKVKEKVDELGINYLVVNDSDGIAQRGFGPIQSVPAIFLINQEGKIYKSYRGYTEKEVLEGDIKALLKQ